MCKPLFPPYGEKVIRQFISLFKVQMNNLRNCGLHLQDRRSKENPFDSRKINCATHYLNGSESSETSIPALLGTILN